MKVILIIITVFALVIGASINGMALTVFEQIYSALFYLMALMSFCTFALLFKGKINWSCRWLKKECGLEDGTGEKSADYLEKQTELSEVFGEETENNKSTTEKGHPVNIRHV